MQHLPAIARSAFPKARRLVARQASTLLCVGGVILLAAVVLFTRLDDRDLWPSHEARAAQEATGFLETGDLGVLRLFDGTPDYQKPPLFYWLVAAIGWLRGCVIDEWSVRLPAAISAWLTVVAVMAWLLNRGRTTAACVAGLSLLCANHFVATSRTGRIDAPLMFCVTASILLWLSDRRLLAGVAVAAAIMLKGPIGPMLVLPVVVAIRRTKSNYTSLVVAIALAAPWIVVTSIQTSGEFAREFFWHHNFERAAGTASDLASHPWWFYPARWIVGWLPATPAVLATLWIAARRRLWSHDPELTVGAVWVVVMTALLSCARFKRADYLMPAYPGMAILIGCVVERVATQANRRWLAVSGGLTLSLALTGSLVYEFALLPRENDEHDRRAIAAQIRPMLEQGDPVVFFRLEDHLLTLHLGKPIHSVKEWENLDVWVSRLQSGLVILNADEAESWTRHIHAGTLREVFRYRDSPRSRMIVVMQSRPHLIASVP